MFKQVPMPQGLKHDNPNIVPYKKQYLVKIDGYYYAGRFDNQWYGLNFNINWGAASKQYDAPGSNSSRWEGIWELE